MMKILKFPFLSLSSFFVLGILSYPFFDKFHLLCAVVAVSILTLILIGPKIFLSAAYRLLYWVFYGLLFWSTGVATVFFHDFDFNKHHYSHYLSDDSADFLRIEILEKTKSQAYSTRYLAAVTNCNGKNTHGKILVSASDKLSLDVFKVGQQLTVYQTVSAVPVVRNPRQFDYGLYLKRQGIYRQLYLKEGQYRLEGISFRLSGVVVSWREFLMASFEVHRFSPEAAGLVNSLLFGQRQDLTTDLKNDFKEVGVIHVLVISGLHIGIIYVVLLQLLKRVGLSTKRIYFVAVLVLWLFALITGFAPPVVRAVVMFSIMAITQGYRGATSIFNSLAVTLFVMLCFNPDYIYDAGFQLSFVAVWSIASFYPLWSSYTRSKYAFIRYFKELIAVSLAVQIGILPVTLYYFHFFPVFFLIANVLVVPIVTVLIVSLLMLLVFNFVWTELSLFFGQFVVLLLEMLVFVVRGLSQFSNYNITQIPFNAFLAIVFSGCLVWVTYGIKRRGTRFFPWILSLILVFQWCYMAQAIRSAQKSENLLLYDREYITFLFKRQHQIELHSNNKEVWNSAVVENYMHHEFIAERGYVVLINLMKVGPDRLLIVDSLAKYKTAVSADVLLFSGNAILNFNRVIEYHEPKLVLVHTTVPSWKTKRIKRFCMKKNIPFHDMSEKGYYKF